MDLPKEIQPSDVVNSSLREREQICVLLVHQLLRERAKACDAREALHEISDFFRDSLQNLLDYIFSLSQALDKTSLKEVQRLREDLDRDWEDFTRHSKLVRATDNKLGSLESSLGDILDKDFESARNLDLGAYSRSSSSSVSGLSEESDVLDADLQRYFDLKASRATLKEYVGLLSARLREIESRRCLLEDQDQELSQPDIALRRDLERELWELEDQLDSKSQELHQFEQDSIAKELAEPAIDSSPSTNQSLLSWLDGVPSKDEHHVSTDSESADLVTLR